MTAHPTVAFCLPDFSDIFLKRLSPLLSSTVRTIVPPNDCQVYFRFFHHFYFVLTCIDRIDIILIMSVYEQVKQALQDVVAPELKSIQVEIRRLDSRVDSLRAEMTSEISSLKTVLTTEIKRLDSKIDSLYDKIDTAIQIRERLASLEAKLASMGSS